MTTTCPVCASPLSEDASVCAICGFKLLGSTQSFKPYVPDSEQITTRPSGRTGAVLSVVRGPQIGMEFKLGDTSQTIGRDPVCDIFLNDMTVSRSHATIAPGEGGYLISDNNSFNGVWVNNESVEVYKLQSGDIVQLGSFCLLYREDEQ